VSRQYQQVADAVPVFMASGIAETIMSYLIKTCAKKKEQAQVALH